MAKNPAIFEASFVNAEGAAKEWADLERPER